MESLAVCSCVAFLVLNITTGNLLLSILACANVIGILMTVLGIGAYHVSFHRSAEG